MRPVMLNFWHPQYVTDDLSQSPGVRRQSADMRDDVSYFSSHSGMKTTEKEESTMELKKLGHGQRNQEQTERH